jgi:hypothetical protein
MRGEECIFDSFDDDERRLPPKSRSDQDVSLTPPFSFPETTSMDRIASICHVETPTEELMSLRLMHHFEHFTSDTLLFGKKFWRDKILPLALHVSNPTP